MSDESVPREEQRPRISLRRDPAPPPPPSPPSPAPSAGEPAPPPADSVDPGVETVKLKMRVPIKSLEPISSAGLAPESGAPASSAPAASRNQIKPGLKPAFEPAAPSTVPMRIPQLTPPASVPPASTTAVRRPGGRPPAGTDLIGQVPSPPVPPSLPAVAAPLPPAAMVPPPIAVPSKSRARKVNLTSIVLSAVGALSLLTAAYFAYLTYFGEANADAVKSSPGAKRPMVAKPTEPASLPVLDESKTIKKLRQAIAAAQASHGESTDTTLAAKTPSESAAATSPDGSVVPPSSISSVPSAIAPAPLAIIEPSSRFRDFVEQLDITGVRVGPPARLFVGGVIYRAGDVIDKSPGVVFVSVDAHAKELCFRDGTGAEIRRRF